MSLADDRLIFEKYKLVVEEVEAADPGATPPVLAPAAPAASAPIQNHPKGTTFTQTITVPGTDAPTATQYTLAHNPNGNTVVQATITGDNSGMLYNVDVSQVNTISDIKLADAGEIDPVTGKKKDPEADTGIIARGIGAVMGTDKEAAQHIGGGMSRGIGQKDWLTQGAFNLAGAGVKALGKKEPKRGAGAVGYTDDDRAAVS